MRRVLKGKSVVGLEFDTEVIRGVELYKRNKQLSLASFAEVTLPRGGMREGLITNRDLVVQGLKALWQKGDFRSRNVVIGISNQDVLIRFASFPHVPLNRVDSLVRFQAQEHLPVPLESVELDYSIIGSRKDGEKTMLELILVAGNKEMLLDFLWVLEKAKLNPLEIEVLNLTLLRLLKKIGEKSAVAILNIGLGFGNMLVADNLLPRLARTMPLYWQDGVKKDFIHSEKIVEELNRNIRSTIGFYQSSRGVKNVEKILLSGIEPIAKSLSDKFKQEIGLMIDVVRPAEMLNYVGDLKAVSSEYSLASCLACRGWE
ncbi:MAG: pilus assembly protein PilM [Bacillota bacterium]